MTLPLVRSIDRGNLVKGGGGRGLFGSGMTLAREPEQHEMVDKPNTIMHAWLRPNHCAAADMLK